MKFIIAAIGMICMSISLFAEVQPNRYLSSHLPADFFQRIRQGNYNRRFYPEFSDRAAWEEVKKHTWKGELIQQIMVEADKITTEEIPVLTFTAYQQFAADGNRGNYEALYLRKRSNFGTLVLALCLSGDKEKYMPHVMNYIYSIMGEWTWCLPAHAKWHGKYPSLIQASDLFTAETGAQLAMAVHLLSKEIDALCPGMTESIRQRVLNQAVYSPLRPETSHLGFNAWFFQERPINWTVWCSYNNLLSLIFLETNNDIIARTIELYLQGVSRFAYYNPDDGFCPEGMTYYPVSSGFLYKATEVLDTIYPGSMDQFYAQPKIRAIFKFISSLRIGNYGVTYADSSPHFSFRQDSVLQCGLRIKDNDMISVGCLKKPSFQKWCGDTLVLNISQLFQLPEKMPVISSELEKVSCFPDHLVVLRSNLFSVSVKGGNNAESHNHNDLGHFSIFFKNQPVIIDSGTARYSKINFSDQRYSLWYTRGSGHNAPVFDGIEQIFGKEYISKLPAPQKTADGFRQVCDLSKAYPETAGVKKFIRTIDFSDNKVVVSDNFELTSPRKVEINLISAVKPEIRDGKVFFKDVVLTLDGLTAAKVLPAEDIPAEVDLAAPEIFENKYPLVAFRWKSALWRVVLESSKNCYQMSFSNQ